MPDRTAIITGATSGIGEATATALVRQGYAVAVICRDAARGEATRARIRAASGHEIAIHLADLAEQAQIRRVAAEVLARYPRIHLLVNNAGLVNLKRETTVDGIETTFAVNHLGYFLLTQLLLDRLKASAPARIVNVASHAHRFVGGINFDDLGFGRGYKAMKVYGHSKLANILFTRELARRLAGTNVTVNAVHPGAVATGLGKNNGMIATGLVAVLGLFFRTAEQGAATSIYVATATALEGVSGRYFANSRESRPSRAAADDTAARRLWDVSAELTHSAA